MDCTTPETAGHPLYTLMIRTALRRHLAVCWPKGAEPNDSELQTACVLHTLLNRGPLLLT